MAQNIQSRKRPAGWWIPGLDDNARRDGLDRIASGATPGFTYFVLIVLSTLIAGFGLLSNSTATVIGAMIVAPLMGPILGVAMGVVSGDTRLFQRSLLAELSGVALVITVGFLIALAVGVDQIDFSASEIANRTRPTLFDLAIGLAAGLAGSFCMIHPGLQASVAGVAIAVALVPPLTVTGITAAGWWTGSLAWRPAFGSFMLFLANYLTIELAASVLFYAVGFHVEKEGRPLSTFRKTIVANMILLLLTVVFLAQQLRTLVRERVGMVTARRSLEKGLSDIPGADLDSLDVVLRGHDLSVTTVVGSRQSVAPTTVAALERNLKKALSRTLPDVKAHLIVRTVNSVYASPTGYLFEPEDRAPTPEQERTRLLGEAITKALQAYPEVENEGFQMVSGQGAQAWNVELTLRSPFEFTPSLVTDLQTRVNQELDTSQVKLLVKSVLVKVATAQSQVAIPSHDVDDAENPALRQIVGEVLEAAGAEVTSLSMRRRPAELGTTGDFKEALTSQAYDVSIEARVPTLFDKARLEALQKRIRATYRQREGQDVTLGLDLRMILGQTVRLDSPPAAPQETPSPSPTPLDQKSRSSTNAPG